MTDSERDLTTGRNVAVIYNPAAGGGKARRRQRFIETALDRYGIPYELFITESETHLVETADSVVRQYPVIIGAGGDTTISIIASAIMRHGTKNALGIISMGSVNDLAREVGLHRLKDSLGAIRDHRVCDLDVGVIHSSENPRPLYFMVSASLGLGVVVNRYVDEWMRKHRFFSGFRTATQQAVAMPGIHQAFKTQQVPIEVSLEAGGETQSLLSSLLVFSNISSFAGVFRPSPTASPVSGSLDCCLFDVSSLAEVLQVSLDIRRQKHLEKKAVRIIRDKSFKVTSEIPLEFQVDGAIVKLEGEVEISILPRALTMFTGKSCIF